MEHHLKTAVSNVQTLAVDKYKQAATGVESFVKGSPWKSIGIATAIGAVIGFFTAKR